VQNKSVDKGKKVASKSKTLEQQKGNWVSKKRGQKKRGKGQKNKKTLCEGGQGQYYFRAPPGLRTGNLRLKGFLWIMGGAVRAQKSQSHKQTMKGGKKSGRGEEAKKGGEKTQKPLFQGRKRITKKKKKHRKF